MDYKETNAPLSTITYDKNEIEAPTENIYEAISIIAKRANQINSDIKNELVEKLDDVKGIHRVRISSIEPNLLKDESIQFVANSNSCRNISVFYLID